MVGGPEAQVGCTKQFRRFPCNLEDFLGMTFGHNWRSPMGLPAMGSESEEEEDPL